MASTTVTKQKTWLNFQLDKEDHEAIRKLATADNRSIGNFMRLIVKDHLKKGVSNDK